MYKDRVTLFNRKDGLWYPTVLQDVNLNKDRASVVKEYGENSADMVILNIHDPAEKPYLDPKEWQNSNAPGSYITFTAGQKFDFFWEGDWPSADPVSDSDYGRMTFYDYMNKTYDNVFAITGVSYFSVIPHWQVTGK